MSEIIPIRKIVTTRKPDAKNRKEDLALASSISKKGLLVPVLVDGEYNLIDGLRRIRAAETLGFTDIQAVVTDDFDESVANLHLAHDPTSISLLPLTIERIWQISSGLSPQAWARILRRRAVKAQTGELAKDRKTQSRSLLTEALRLPGGGGYIDDLSFFYRRVGYQDEVGAFARLAVKKMESQEWTPYGARGHYTRWAKDRNRKSDESTQRQVLSRAATNLTAIARPLADMGALHHRLTDDELYTWEQLLHDARTVLTTTINKIRKEREQRNNA